MKNTITSPSMSAAMQAGYDAEIERQLKQINPRYLAKMAEIERSLADYLASRVVNENKQMSSDLPKFGILQNLGRKFFQRWAKVSRRTSI